MLVAVVTANLHRPDIDEVQPGYGEYHGFEYKPLGLSVGTHRAKAYAINYPSSEKVQVGMWRDFNVSEERECWNDSDCTFPDICENHMCTTPVQTCQNQGFDCCDSCQSDPHPEYDNDCLVQLCCGSCQGHNCHNADLDCDGCIDITELMGYISLWRTGSVSIEELVVGIEEWKDGC